MRYSKLLRGCLKMGLSEAGFNRRFNRKFNRRLGRGLAVVLVALGLLTGQPESLPGALSGRAGAVAGDRIMVLPFENRSQRGDYNWIRESFPIQMAEALEVPGIEVLSSGERNQAFERMRLNPEDLLTRAAMIRLAEAARANLALIGEFDIGGEKDAVTIAVTARLVETTEGRLVANRVFNFSGPLSELQQMQGQLAWNLLYLRNPSLPYTKEQLVARATVAPPLAYQSYVKAVLTADRKLRESFLRRAIQEFDASGAPGHFGAAIFELGLLNYRQGSDSDALAQLAQLNPSDRHFDEGLFIAGLSAWRSSNYELMAERLNALAAARPHPAVFNNLGLAELMRGNLQAGLSSLLKAAANAPADAILQFNYGYALWRNGQAEEAIIRLRQAVQANPRDGEALYLLAKCLAATGREAEAAKADNEARHHLQSYAKWEVDPQSIPPLGRLKQDFDVVRSAGAGRVAESGGPLLPQMLLRQRLDRARGLLDRQEDGAALTEVEAVIAAEGNNAEAHYLRGLIHLRRGEGEAALSALQSAVTWDPRRLDAHLELGRLYLARNDQARALSHINQVLAIDARNRVALTLRRQIETSR